MSNNPDATGGGFSGRALLRNAASLYSLQALNILVPAFAFPFIVRSVGVLRFGEYAFAVSIVQLAVFVTDFGFNLTATRRVSVAQQRSMNEVSKEFSVTLVLKGALMLVASGCLAIAVASISALRDHVWLYVALTPILVGEVLFPVWLLQGLQRMQYLPIISFLGRAVSLGLLVALVDGPEDLLLVAVTQSIPFVLNGFMALWVARYRLGVRFAPIQSRETYREALSEARQAFVSRLASQVYTRGALPLLGAMASPAAVGLFSIAQKIGAIVIAVIVQPLAQSIYPQLCLLWENSPSRVRAVRWKMLGLGLVGLVLALGTLNTLAGPVIHLITGSANPEAVDLVHVYSGVIALSALNSLLATVVTAMRRFGDLSRAVVVGSIVFVASAVPLVALYDELGMAIASILVELTVGGVLHYMASVGFAEADNGQGQQGAGS